MSHTHRFADSFIPAVVVRRVDGAVRKVGSSTELWQTLGVQQRPGAAVVGGKLQTHANGKQRTSYLNILICKLNKLKWLE